MVVEGEDCYENNLDVAFGPGLSAHTRTGIKRGAGIRFNLTRGCSFLSVGKTASGESGQNDGGLERDRGIGNFAEARGNERMQWGKRFQPVVLSGCRAKALCGKEAFLPT
jgi:hypothetical protein